MTDDRSYRAKRIANHKQRARRTADRGEADSRYGGYPERRSRGSGLLQVERHEDTVRVEHIVGEGRALHEAMVPIKCLRRPKIFPGARLEAEARHASYSCGRNDVAQHRASRSPSAHGLSGMHRLDLTMIGRESLQRADPQEPFIVPYRPKADVGRL